MPLWSGKQLGHSCSARLSCFLQNQRNSNVGLAGIIHIQNSVRASKSPTWKQGDRLSIGNGRVLARTTPANQSSDPLCQLPATPVEELKAFES